MEKNELVAKLESDKNDFNGFISECRKHPTKLINPKNQNKLIMSASCVAYIDNLLGFLSASDNDGKEISE